MRITVVGGGIVGLSCALRLVQAGNDVTIISADKAADTTSAVAGGIIYPPDTQPEEQCAAWTAVSLAEFRSLAAPGIRFLPGKMVMPADEPWPAWTSVMDGLEFDGDAFSFTTALVDTPVYLDWLVTEVAAAGVRFEYRTVEDLSGIQADLVVNAAGLGGGALAGDDTIVPVGGQVVHLADPGLTEWIVDVGEHVSYVIPHGGHVVCGGTEEEGRVGTEPDLEVTRAIVRRCRELVPALADAEVLQTRVGLRPFRPEVRLERVGDVIHCYGHGSSGITLSWGCADDVAALAAV